MSVRGQRTRITLVALLGCTLLHASCGEGDAPPGFFEAAGGEGGAGSPGDPGGASATGGAGGSRNDSSGVTQFSGELDCEVALPTGSCFVGKPYFLRHTVTRYQHTPDDAKLELRQYEGFLSFDTTFGHENWSVDILPPVDGFLQPGIYPVFDLLAPLPGTLLNTAWDDICQTTGGLFDIQELELDRLGRVVRLSFDFEQECDGQLQNFGKVRWHATGVRDAPAPHPESCEVATPTGFCIASRAGDPLARGNQLHPDARDGVFRATTAPGERIRVTFENHQTWTFDLQAPVGSIWEPGRTYEVDETATPTLAGLDVRRSPFLGCRGDLGGTLDLIELVRAGGGVQTLAADFELSCNESPPLHGKLRFAGDSSNGMGGMGGAP